VQGDTRPRGEGRARRPVRGQEDLIRPHSRLQGRPPNQHRLPGPEQGFRRVRPGIGFLRRRTGGAPGAHPRGFEVRLLHRVRGEEDLRRGQGRDPRIRWQVQVPRCPHGEGQEARQGPHGMREGGLRGLRGVRGPDATHDVVRPQLRHRPGVRGGPGGCGEGGREDPGIRLRGRRGLHADILRHPPRLPAPIGTSSSSAGSS